MAMTSEQIEKLKRERNAKARMMKDKSVYVISLMTLPTLMILVLALILSAIKLEDSQLAVISGLISSVSIGLITLLQRSVGGAEKEDPMVVIAKALVEHLTAGDGTKEIIVDKASVRISGKDSKMVASGTKDLVYGDDKK
jgi:hypothetical protein